MALGEEGRDMGPPERGGAAGPLEGAGDPAGGSGHHNSDFFDLKKKLRQRLEVLALELPDRPDLAPDPPHTPFAVPDSRACDPRGRGVRREWPTEGTPM